jgi:hypothetical protein
VRVRAADVFVSGSGANSVSEVDVSKPAAPRLAGSVTSSARLNHTTGLDVDPTDHFVIASSPALSSETQKVFPPFPLTPAGPPKQAPCR